MTDLFYDVYDGELTFDIVDCDKTDDLYEFVLKANYEGNEVGLKISFPIIKRRALFKSITLLNSGAQVEFSSIGIESDNLIVVLEQLLKPAYKSSGKFSENIETLDFSVLNREMYDIDSDKIYTKIFNGEDQTGLDEDERINCELNFTFNLSTMRASLIEVRDGYSADLVAVLMN